ncbi:lipopolysaccharide biosynthesis protein [Vibrio comitans]|uniref:Sugar translocase n=1 Tax=Vibrio comitans NBRC 102076 TaxID=1219078 RepID=A0A4Y3IK34_9VIBR|nr:oligosaccharide flippase family protein [Vibrio comitans]GEA59372.1 sugar translocase [Vibrio comitans NBRC 102076]
MKLAAISDAQKQMLGYAFALFFMKGLSLIMLPITTRFLSPVQIGELELLAVTASFIGILLSASLHEALYRYCAEQTTKNQRLRTASNLFTLTLLVSVSFACLGFIVTLSLEWKETWAISRQAVLVLWVSLTIEGAIAISLAWLRMQDRVKAFCRICITTSLFQVALVLTLLQLGYGVVGVLTAGFIAHFIQLLLLIHASNLSITLPNTKFINTTLRYSLPLMLSGLVAFGLNGAERWLMLKGESLAMVGQYAVAAKFALAMCVLVQPFGMWWMPKRFMVAKSNPYKAARTTELGIMYVCILALFIGLFGQWLLEFALTDDYAIAGELLVGALFMVLGKEFAELLNLGLLQSKQTKTILTVNLWTTIVTLIWCGFTYHFGIWSIMLSIGVAQLIKALILYKLSQCHCTLPYRSLRLSVYPVITLAGLVAIQLGSTLQGLSSLACSFVLLLATYTVELPKHTQTKKVGV